MAGASHDVPATCALIIDFISSLIFNLHLIIHLYFLSQYSTNLVEITVNMNYCFKREILVKSILSGFKK